MIARTCKECGKLFSSISREICPKCIEKEKESYHIVEDLLKQQPGISLMDICEQTGIEEKLVLKFIREGKLKGLDQNLEISCETCGKPITGGRLCPTCMDKFSAGLKGASDKEEDKDEKKGMLSKRTKEE